MKDTDRSHKRMRLAAVFASIFISAGPVSGQTPGAKGLISEQMLWPHLRNQLRMLGDRLVKPGKERIVLAGSINRSSGNAQVTVTKSTDGKIRIDEQNKNSIGHDGNQSWRSGGTIGADDGDLIETLLNDTAEHFFLSMARNGPSRFYGARFRTDDGTTPNYKGPYYDVYEVADKVDGASRVRVYCLNSDTLFLEKVQYRITRAGATVRVETVLSGWQDFQGQKFPTKISRTENDSEVFAVTYSAVQVRPDAADGVFQRR